VLLQIFLCAFKMPNSNFCFIFLSAMIIRTTTFLTLC
jgi:hypothetical protein